MDKLELVMRNTEEIVTVDELKGLLEQSRRPRAYVGYETSGKVHLGHMLTANKLLDLQKAGFDVVVLLADLHAFLNEKGTLEEVRKIADYNRDCFMALGLDPERTEFVYGTDYQLKPEYMLKILQMARNTTLNRAEAKHGRGQQKCGEPHGLADDLPADAGHRHRRPEDRPGSGRH